MIICGHALIGKSTLGKEVGGVIDLESSIFCKNNFSQYVSYIESLHNQGKIILTSCHKLLRDELLYKGLDYIVILPHESEKDRYVKLAKDRQPHPLKAETVSKFWDSWRKIESKEKYHVLDIGKHLTLELIIKLFQEDK